ncbi:MAG: DUF2125 domain-containing protein [Pseudomonadota bacterium]
MKTLLVLVLVATALYSGYWFVGARAQQAGLNAWLDAQRAQGWVAETQDLSVMGYPNRFDTRITGLELADPNAGWAWSAPEFQILALSYKPNHIIAVWPGQQTMATPVGTLLLEAERMRGSVIFAPNTRLTLDRTTIELEAVALSGLAGWEAQLDEGLLSTRRSPDGTAPDFAHDISLTATGLSLPDGLRDVVDRAREMPEQISDVVVVGTVAFDKPWDRLAVEGNTPRMTGASLGRFEANWGPLQLTAKGEVSVRADRSLQGEIDVEARNWKRMLRLATRAGVFDADTGRTIERGLDLLARFGGDQTRIKVPLRFDGGRTWLGPIPLGPAPKV